MLHVHNIIVSVDKGEGYLQEYTNRRLSNRDTKRSFSEGELREMMMDRLDSNENAITTKEKCENGNGKWPPSCLTALRPTTYDLDR
eukprot:scaffold10548_cov110-Skeletonema_dohrnii-CCMP3373.AAC.3